MLLYEVELSLPANLLTTLSCYVTEIWWKPFRLHIVGVKYGYFSGACMYAVNRVNSTLFPLFGLSFDSYRSLSCSVSVCSMPRHDY